MYPLLLGWRWCFEAEGPTVCLQCLLLLLLFEQQTLQGTQMFQQFADKLIFLLLLFLVIIVPHRTKYYGTKKKKKKTERHQSGEKFIGKSPFSRPRLEPEWRIDGEENQRKSEWRKICIWEKMQIAGSTNNNKQMLHIFAYYSKVTFFSPFLFFLGKRENLNFLWPAFWRSSLLISFSKTFHLIFLKCKSNKFNKLSWQ